MDAGTIIWCAFGALLAYALLAQLVELLWAGAGLAWDWARGVRVVAAPEPPTHAPPPADLDDVPWVDAYTQRFGEQIEDGEEPSGEPPPAPEGPDCGTCGRELVPVVYGFPGGELIDLAEQGRVILGGCVPGGPRFLCPAGHRPRGAGIYSDDPWSPALSRLPPTSASFSSRSLG